MYSVHCKQITSPVSLLQVLTVHSPEHWDFLEMLPGFSNRDFHREGENYDSIYLSKGSFRAAKLSAGCLLAVTEEVLSNKVGILPPLCCPVLYPNVYYVMCSS